MLRTQWKLSKIRWPWICFLPRARIGSGATTRTCGMPLTADLVLVRRILQRDRNWSVYALADLAPEYRAGAEWHISENQSAVLLIYRGFTPPVLFAHGDPGDLDALLPEIPETSFYLSVRAPVVARLESRGYCVPHPLKMWRYILNPARFAPRRRQAVPLTPGHYEALGALYDDGRAAKEAPPFFQRDMLRHGIYYGIQEGREIVAAAGTHVLAPAEGVA